MSLIRRKLGTNKKVNIDNEEFYSSLDAANLLGFSKRKLTDGLKCGRFPFKYGTLEDIP